MTLVFFNNAPVRRGVMSLALSVPCSASALVAKTVLLPADLFSARVWPAQCRWVEFSVALKRICEAGSSPARSLTNSVCARPISPVLKHYQHLVERGDLGSHIRIDALKRRSGQGVNNALQVRPDASKALRRSAMETNAASQAFFVQHHIGGAA